MNNDIEPVVGRYTRLDIGGRIYRLYWEEAGDGIPLLCLHTAGSDSRQFRHLMNDHDITAHFRVIAFDMPYHGKSSPPAGWQDEEYQLTTEAYTQLILSVMEALGLDRPVLMGCSIGGRIVLNLAVECPGSFRGLIGLQSAAYQEPWYDTDWLHRSDIHGGEVCAALVSGLVAPGGPTVDRHETLWHYMQSGPGVFKGDLYFYRVDGDLRPKLPDIELDGTPLYLLTGQYDFSCRPEDTIRTAEVIPGAEVTVMEDLGHFPMSENPEQFRRYILPILDSLRATDQT